MKKKSKEKHFIKKPTYVGGLKAMRTFISNEMIYPKLALKNRIEGTVFLKYEVDYKGTVVSSKVLSPLGYGCDEEAQRIVSKLKFYVGKNPRKLRIKFNKSIKIYFRIPKKKTEEKPKNPTAQPTQEVKKIEKITYSITTSTVKENDKPNSVNYNYTITY